MLKRLFLQKLILIVLLGFICPLQAATTQADKTLTFGIYGYIRSDVLYRKFTPLIDHIQKQLNIQGWNIEIQVKLYPNYDEAIDALTRGQIDFARFGAVSYILAKDKNPDIQLLAMENNFGRKYFNGVIFVKKDSPIQTLADVKGKMMAFGSKDSTTGRYLAQAVLKNEGITGADLAGYDYLGQHDAVALSVSKGDFQAGASNENTFNRYKDRFGLRSITTFSCVTKPWIVRDNMDANLFNALQTILFELNDMNILKDFKRNGFVKAEDSDYDQIRKGMFAASDFPVKY
jgi:phosphonate transport system substrate-binding protein